MGAAKRKRVASMDGCAFAAAWSLEAARRIQPKLFDSLSRRLHARSLALAPALALASYHLPTPTPTTSTHLPCLNTRLPTAGSPRPLPPHLLNDAPLSRSSSSHLQRSCNIAAYCPSAQPNHCDSSALVSRPVCLPYSRRLFNANSHPASASLPWDTSRSPRVTLPSSSPLVARHPSVHANRTVL